MRNIKPEEISVESLKDSILGNLTTEDYRNFRAEYDKFIPKTQRNLSDFNEEPYKYLYDYIKKEILRG